MIVVSSASAAGEDTGTHRGNYPRAQAARGSSPGPGADLAGRAAGLVGGVTRRGLLGLVAGGWTAAQAQAPVPAQGPRRVIRALVESWPPYLEISDDGHMHGLDADLLQAICKQAGFQLSWVQGPSQWRRRRYRELLDDKFDVIFSATPVARDDQAIMYSRPYRNETMSVFAPDPHGRQVEGLKGFGDLLARRIRLLHVESGGLGEDFESHRQRLHQAGLLIPYPTTRQGIDMLRLGRAPLILGDALDLRVQARAAGVRLVAQPYGHSVLPVSLLLSRRRLSAADLARIDQAIVTLEQRGVLGTIRRRYGLP